MTTETEGVKCFGCKAPFHIASGDFMGPKNTPFCGACVRSFKDYVISHSKARYNKVNFYKHATVPPPAKIRRFRFLIDKAVRRDETNVFTVTSFVGRGVTYEEARQSVLPLIPEGNRIYCDYEMIETDKE